MSAGQILLLIVLAVAAGGVIVVRRRHLRRVAFWAELARQTGLQFKDEHSGTFGAPHLPRLDGLYRGRRVSISTDVEYVHDAEGAGGPVYSRCIDLEVRNSAGCRLDIHRRHLLRVFLHLDQPTSMSGNKHFDRRFQIDGLPTDFLEGALRLMVPHSILFTQSQGALPDADYRFSQVGERLDSLSLQGMTLNCMQRGTPTDAAAQLALLDLLCGVAELAERS